MTNDLLPQLTVKRNQSEMPPLRGAFQSIGKSGKPLSSQTPTDSSKPLGALESDQQAQLFPPRTVEEPAQAPDIFTSEPYEIEPAKNVSRYYAVAPWSNHPRPEDISSNNYTLYDDRLSDLSATDLYGLVWKIFVNVVEESKFFNQVPYEEAFNAMGMDQFGTVLDTIYELMSECLAGSVRMFDITHVAYLLATAEQESSFGVNQFENDDSSYQGYSGRGYIQLTGPDQYKALGRVLGVGDYLYENPDLLRTDNDLSAFLAVYSLQTDFLTNIDGAPGREGDPIRTGDRIDERKPISHYIKDSPDLNDEERINAFRAARDIVNGGEGEPERTNIATRANIYYKIIKEYLNERFPDNRK
ncbi:MAG: hypothetical protein AAGG51_04840 [Cyanobacteria bacterium P01_G01_bin.54]